MRRRRLLLAALLLPVGALWFIAATRLWDTSVPSDLRLPDVDPARVVDQRVVARAERFERVSRLLTLFEQIALLVVLAFYAWRGHRFMRESAAGRIGTGMLLGMLGLALVWLVQLPFSLVQTWWQDRYGLVELEWYDALLEDWLVLAAEFLFICLALLIVMALAGIIRRNWWIAAAPAFVALGIVFAFLLPYLSDLKRLGDPALEARARQLAAALGTDPVPVRKETVSDGITVPNAWAGGIGPSRRVVLWDTLLDGRFSDEEVAVVVAHELSHHARRHIWKGVGWYALFAVPGAFLIAVATRRRGGMAQPEAVPVALLVLVALQTLALPLDNEFSRRLEAEADWSALDVTRTPSAAEALFAGFTQEALADPTPPGWSYLLFESHPSVEDRVAMAHAWAARHGRHMRVVRVADYRLRGERLAARRAARHVPVRPAGRSAPPGRGPRHARRRLRHG